MQYDYTRNLKHHHLKKPTTKSQTTKKTASKKVNKKVPSKKTAPLVKKNKTSALKNNVVISFVKPAYSKSSKKIQINRNRSYTLKQGNIYYYHRNDTIVMSKKTPGRKK